MCAVVLTHQSALEYWQSSLRFDPKGEVSYARNSIRVVPKRHQLEAPLSGGIRNPLHVLVADDKLRRHNNAYLSHAWEHPLPQGSVIDSGKGFYVVSPELCFIIMARSLSFIELVKIGFDFCGSYLPSSETIYSCCPLTSTERINDCIERNKGVAGTAKARKALIHVLDNSASPMETTLTMLLSLPFKYGGYGFEPPVLNYRVDKRANRRGTTLADHFKCDLAWPKERIALEYDSKKFHGGSERFVGDSIRRTELINLGYSVISVTLPQIETVMGTRNLATALANQMNRRLRLVEPRFSEAHAKLRRELF